MSVTFDFGSSLKFILYAAAAVAVLLLLRAAWKFLRGLFGRPELYGLDREGVRARWAEIEKLAEGQGEMSLKMAVMEADKLLDHALKAMSMPGTTLGERLKFAAYKYRKINEVWWAHRLRNQLVHESSFRLDQNMARRAVRTYKSALEMLNLL